MEEKVIKINADTSDANKEIAKTTKGVESLGKETTETNKTIKKTGETTEKAGKTGSKGVGLISKGFKVLGTAMKAAGIGLIIALVAGLGSAFSKNQRFLNAFNAVTETISTVFGDLVTALFTVSDAVFKNSENFNALGKVLNGIITLALTPFKLAFLGIKLGVQNAQLVWENSFFGGNDKETIKNLTADIIATGIAIFETGKNSADAGKDIVNNFGEAILETAVIATKVVEEVGKISVKSAFETAQSNVAIRNSAVLAIAQQTLLLERFDRLAEKQRQIRDDETKSISVRQAANDELGRVLKLQEDGQIRQANLQIASAQADVNKNKTIENQAVLVQALANKEGVLAAIVGFQSEQDINRIALKKEEIQLNESISDADKERRLAQLAFDESQEENEILKLAKQKERLDLENQTILEDLERKRLLFLEGTQARVDAEQIFLTEKQRIDNELLANTRATNLAIDANNKTTSEDEVKLNQSVADAKNSIANRTANLLMELGGKAAKVGKAIAVAQTIRSGIEGVQNAYSTAQKSPITALFPAYPIAQAGLAGAFSALQVKKILSTSQVGGSGGAGGSQGGGQESSAPSFNLVQGTDSNQIAQSINQGNQTPTQAFVVGSAVTSQQELDANKINIGSI
jgi:hypothetical protein